MQTHMQKLRKGKNHNPPPPHPTNKNRPNKQIETSANEFLHFGSCNTIFLQETTRLN